MRVVLHDDNILEYEEYEVSFGKMHPLYRILSTTITGRLRSQIAQEWSGSSAIFPPSKTVWANIMSLWRQNSHSARLYFHVFNSPPVNKVDLNRHFSRQSVVQLLEKLRAHHPIHRLLAEGKIDDSEREVGCLVLGHELPSGAPGYYGFIFEEISGLVELSGHVSIMPPSSETKALMAVEGEHGWVNVAPRQINKFPQVRAVLRLLESELQRHSPTKHWSPGLTAWKGIEDPPIDEKYMELVNGAMKGFVQVTRALVSMQSIRPHDLSYFQKAAKVDVNRIDPNERLLLYWEDGRFVLSDDYHLFCQHTAEAMQNVHAAILGDFPLDAALVQDVGGADFLPAPTFQRSASIQGLSHEDEFWLAQHNLRQKNKKSVNPEYLLGWLFFAELVANQEVKERALHDFIVAQSAILSEYGEDVVSEVSLDGKYRVDLLVSRRGRMPQVWLIELEQANHRVLTRDGQETKEVTHAIQQVSDWLMWWRSNSNHPLVKQYGNAEPNGVVVIGRSLDLSDQEVLRMAHNNQNRKIKVITYDELLDKFGAFILSQVDDESV